MIDSGLVGRKVPHGEKMLYSGTDPESYITEYTLVYEDYGSGHHLNEGSGEDDGRGNDLLCGLRFRVEG